MQSIATAYVTELIVSCRMVAPRLSNLEGLMTLDDDIDGAVSETFAR
jgi:hypothetical protein